MKRRVVILGGGVAGLEALMALHDLAGDRAELTLVEPEPPPRSVDVEVALPIEWHSEPMALDPYSSPTVD